MSAPNVVSGRKGEWMQVASGGKFFPQDPRFDEIEIDDIANGLALTCRYGGQGDVNKFYSVAEHSMLMADYALRYTDWLVDENKIRFALIVLLHDAAEAYAGDLIKSVKSAVADTYAPLEYNIQKVVLQKFGLFEAALCWADMVKEIDNRIVVNEKAVLFSPRQAWSSDVFAALPNMGIKCYDPPTAKKLWLDLFHELNAARGVNLCFG